MQQDQLPQELSRVALAAGDPLRHLCNGRVSLEIPLEHAESFGSVNIETLHQPAFGLADDVPRRVQPETAGRARTMFDITSVRAWVDEGQP